MQRQCGVGRIVLTWCKIMGLLAKSTSGLGTLRVSGRSLVPNPPTRIKAFMVSESVQNRTGFRIPVTDS
jgi:hypothetical protein